MQLKDQVEIRLNHPDNHPIVIGLQLNSQMRCWEIAIMVGNYKTQEDAMTDAKGLKRAVEDYMETILEKKR
jgi:hypothetical protein